MTPPLTKAQRRVLDTPGHLLVDAGAGSGKTTTVVQALCHQLGVPVRADGGDVAPVATPLDLEQVAAITFTNQAAADLKRKLRAALRAGGRADLASEVDAARIGTIHSFCGDLLRDYALRAGTRPGRTLLTDAEAASRRADRVRAVLHAALQHGDVAHLDALLTGRQLKHISRWIEVASEDAGRLMRWAAGADALRPHEQALLTLAMRAAEAHAHALDDRGEIDFDRMIGAARELVVRTDVRRAVQRRLRLLIVDEFQDVDPVQREIVDHLGGLADPLDPSPARLILVGDPKQSIYRFRRADVTVWNEMAERFDAGAGKVVPLDENFRSKSAILGFVDAVVGPQLDAPVDGIAAQAFEVPYRPLQPRAPGRDGDHAVECIAVSTDDEGKARKAADARPIEAFAIADRIAELHDDGRPWRDFAILLAGWSDVETYTDALATAGIPFYVRRGEGFWEAREVLDAVLALRVLRDRTDDVAMVGFLRSPFVGVRDDTLLALGRARGERPFADVLATGPLERPLLDQAAALISRFAPLRDRLPAHDLLQRLLVESGYLAVAASMEDGAQRVANLRKLVREASRAPAQSLGEFLREIALARAREEQVAPERLYSEQGDVVTVSSIHGAKGLEWPVVFWADLARQKHAETDALIRGRARFAIKSADAADEDDGKDHEFEAVRREDAAEKEAETRRLWYVAATRAKDLLVVSGIPLGELKADSPAKRIRDALPGIAHETVVEYASAEGVVYHAPVRVASPVVHELAFRPLAVPEFAEPRPPIRVPAGALRLSATQLMAFARDPLAWRRTYVTRFDPALAATDGARDGRAIIAGQVVHEALERLGARDGDLEAVLEQSIAHWDEDAPEAESDLGRQYRAFLRARIAAAQGAPVWRALHAHASARRELTFMRIRPDGTAINGAFDLVAREGDAVRIVDVKNSATPAGTLAERYAVQAAVYIDAARTIAGVDDCTFELLALPAADGARVVPTTDVDGLVERLRESGLRSGA